MKKSQKAKSTKKDIAIIFLLLANLIISATLAFSYFSLNRRISYVDMHISYQKLVTLARTQCLEETGGLDCDSIELNEELAERFRQEYLVWN